MKTVTGAFGDRLFPRWRPWPASESPAPRPDEPPAAAHRPARPLAVAQRHSEPPTTTQQPSGPLPAAQRPDGPDTPPADQTPQDQTPQDQTPYGKTPQDQTALDQTPHQTGQGRTPQGRTPQDGATQDQTPQDEAAQTMVVPVTRGASPDEPPFWLPDSEQDSEQERHSGTDPAAPQPDGGSWPPPRADRSWSGLRLRSDRPWPQGGPGPSRSGRNPPPQRRLVLGMVALVLFSLFATFFAWVSAEPLWLAVGHGDRGIATVTHCLSHGVPYECVAFTATDGAFTVQDVALLGTDQAGLRQGTSVPAQMVSPRSSRAYAVDPAGLNLRWAIGLALILLCGLGIGWATGAGRLDDRRGRRRAFLACLGAPLLLTLGFLAATW